MLMDKKSPVRLPLADKPIWTYRDCFPDERPLKLTSTFCHKNYNIDMHSHDFYEINITVNGEGMHYANHKSYKVSTGDVVVIPPEIYHGYHNGDKLNVFHVLVHRNYFNKYSGDLSVLSAFNLLLLVDPALRDSYTIPLFHIEGKIYEDILFLLQKLDELEQQTNKIPDRADYLLTYSLSFTLIVTLCKEYARQYAPFIESAEKTDDIGIISVSEYIYRNFAQKITLDDLCCVSMMSKTLLCEKFKKYFGQTPMNYVNRYRVLIAKNMVIETDKTITEIAQETGFFDVSHMLKVYSRYESESPSKLREGLRKNLKGTR